MGMGNRLAGLIAQRGMRPAALAREAGVSKNTIYSMIRRDNDKAETVLHRLEVYHSETEPLKGYYEAKGILSPVANQATIEGTTKVIMEALGI